MAAAGLSPMDVLIASTRTAAMAMGREDIGTLEAGKNADVVIWSANPFSVYAKAEKVYIDGALVYDRNDPRVQPRSDFMLGNTPEVVR